jgi:hypothetical protein
MKTFTKKLTAYQKQVKEDRRQAALDRRNGDDYRVEQKHLYSHTY